MFLFLDFGYNCFRNCLFLFIAFFSLKDIAYQLQIIIANSIVFVRRNLCDRVFGFFFLKVGRKKNYLVTVVFVGEEKKKKELGKKILSKMVFKSPGSESLILCFFFSFFFFEKVQER